MPRFLAWVSLLLLLAPSASAVSVRTRLSPPGRGLQIRLDPITVSPGKEREVCQLITLPNKKPVEVHEINVAMPSGADYASHHFAMFLYQGDPTVPDGTTDAVGCVGVDASAGVAPILAFVQRSKQRIRFPRGVGVTLEPHQRLMLNAHWVNGGTEPVTVDVATNFKAVPRRAIKHHARSFQLGTLRIDVPPQADGSASASWIAPFPMNVVWLSTHSHKHTTSVAVDIVRDGVPANEELVTTSYSEPTVKLYPKPLRLEANDGFSWTCNYRNDKPRHLFFGVTSEDEMCFTVGFFYPDDDAAPLPPIRRCFGNGAGLVCPLQ